MTAVVFYEKPGCASNRRQQQLLRAAGIDLQVRDLLGEAWSAERLRPFFAGRPVGEWFNRAAPAIKSGALDPRQLSAEQALALLLAEPLLIRRPLLQLGAAHLVGFDPAALNALLPAAQQLPAAPDGGDGCARAAHGHAACPPPRESRP
ncbi:nitrogenase-associated protein [Geopseudomonas sagittaria]|uniref:Nitrogenase-associated protein n=1 Tax=Geopseudomonas sagittaria TaxID=1135990 RepID=A0A1I5V7U9_9GAMM|nr:ArsC/Spx/MgsR family protein [Pseudomonas sagittaria]MCM2332316.1 arsenate reductase family protein [Pseudomonas sagittaria]SFQ03492.1 nitrogenase-associated protein [Pseudomonas sagittaria]